MLPFITYKKTVVVNRDTYQLFNSINDMDLHKGLFKSNAFDLTASVEQSAPLIMKFSRNNGGFGKGNLDATLWATFENANHNNTKINIMLRNWSMLIPVGLLLLSIFVGIIKQNFTLSNIVVTVLVIGVFACLDIYKKSILLKRFEELIHNC